MTEPNSHMWDWVSDTGLLLLRDSPVSFSVQGGDIESYLNYEGFRVPDCPLLVSSEVPFIPPENDLLSFYLHLSDFTV